MSCCSLAILVRTRLRRLLAPSLCLAVLTGGVRLAAALEFRFDYSYDASGFFGTDAAPTPARAALEFASRAFTPFADQLAAIEPGGANAWTAIVRNPGNGGQIHLPNLKVGADEILVFAGARDLLGAKLAEAGRGIYSFAPGTNSSAAFNAAVINRGQGDFNRDFAPWGGYIELDLTASNGSARQWHFDHQTPPPSDAFDFYTVAVHELAHLLGFGTSNAFQRDLSGDSFAGGAVSEVYNGAPLLHTDHQHWGMSVSSPTHAGASPPTPSMAPVIDVGERRLFTPLDYAALADIGWQVAPEMLELPGDANGDQVTDGSDFLAWQRNLGGFGGSRGDVNGDFRVDAYDGWLIRQSFGAVGATPSPWNRAGSVPEPAVLPLIAAAAMAVIRQRRRTRPLVILSDAKNRGANLKPYSGTGR